MRLIIACDACGQFGSRVAKTATNNCYICKRPLMTDENKPDVEQSQEVVNRIPEGAVECRQCDGTGTDSTSPMQCIRCRKCWGWGYLDPKRPMPAERVFKAHYDPAFK